MRPEIWTLISTAFGALVAILTTMLAAKSSSNNQEKIQKFKIDSDFRLFQQNNFLDLQDKISNTMRLIGKIHNEDLEYFKTYNTWSNDELKEELNEKVSVSFRELNILTERVEDGEFRTKLKDLTTEMAECLLAKTKVDATRRIFKLMNNCDKLLEELGNLLRGYYKAQ